MDDGKKCGEPMPPGEMFMFHGGPKPPKRQWYGVFSHGICAAAFPDFTAAERWAGNYFANNTPWAVKPIEHAEHPEPYNKKT